MQGRRKVSHQKEAAALEKADFAVNSGGQSGPPLHPLYKEWDLNPF